MELQSRRAECPRVRREAENRVEEAVLVRERRGERRWKGEPELG